MERTEDTTILITGATDGLGEKVATDLARGGMTLLLHGRNPEKGRRVLAGIRETTGNERLHYLNADLASLDEVRRLAAEVSGSRPRLDVLINNAGLGAGSRPAQRETSTDGFELRWGVNYLAPFLLTRLLLPLLRATAEKAGESRIVNVASVAQRSIDFDDVMLERSYDGMRAYSQSKLALVMLTFDLAEQLAGTGVTATALHPASLMDTRMVREWFGTPRTTVEEGARHVELLAVSKELAGVNGIYFDQDKPSRVQEQAYDEDSRRRLRELSLRWTGLG
ncbi:SDR family NAD(P)-dependent oxidoreductase [Geobacter sp. SVR]|uniref:SDR family NAD(P)-dependent oxidoreductase n=1 Tax=Geobacter sp. SVR TaxID=2495594 RepID=UPI00143EFEB0|nr:SDR family NAD(P)-dependent oxidoreductase [Geobacter sp. SVR]BCS53867.1 3-oxoacyl-ACP reductase [Geobacter sp. SVR]GCF85624.1 3-oxoacyl-ACP reductase [Geobacter sp. SVR]